MTEKEMLKAIFDDMQNVKNEIKELKLTLENVTNKNIQIIAEGHIDLNRKLDDALKSDHDRELLMIKVNYMEDEIRKLKRKIESIA